MKGPFAAVLGIAMLLCPLRASAERTFAAFSLDMRRNVEKKLDTDERAALEEALRGTAAKWLSPSGWTVLPTSVCKQKLTDANVDPVRCREKGCTAAAARAISVAAYLMPSVSLSNGRLSAQVQLTDALTGQSLGSVAVEGGNGAALAKEFEGRAQELFTNAGVLVGSPVGGDRAGELYLKVDPPDASYQLDGGAETPLLPSRRAVLPLPLGRHRIVIHKEGFQDRREDVVIQRGRVTTVSVALLVRLPSAVQTGDAGLTVDSAPQGARIILDGQDTGIVTPNTFTGLSGGSHQLIVQLEGFVDWRETVLLKNDETRTLKVPLKPNFGSLEIVSDPPGAQVLVDGRAQPDATPLQLGHVEAKAVHIAVNLAEHAPFERVVVVEPGVTITLHATMEPKYGTLVLRPTPNQAQAFLNDAPLEGLTPLTKTQLEAGIYRLRLSLAGHADVERDIVIRGGQATTVDDKLSSNFGGLTVNADVNGVAFKGAEVRVNGAVRGTTPLVIERMANGEVEIKVEADMHLPATTKLTVRSGETARFDAHLTPDFGLVTAKSTPVAPFSVDGEEIGPADGTTYQVRKGQRRLTIATPDGKYVPSETKVLVEVGNTIPLNVTLKTRLGLLDVRSDPPNARISLNGTDAGVTPLKLKDIVIGSHALKLSLDGYLPYTETVEIQEGRTTNVEAFLKSLSDAQNEEATRRAHITRTIVAGSTTGAIAIGSGVAFLFAHQFSAKQASAMATYNAATDAQSVAAARTNVQSSLASARTSQLTGFITAGVAALALGWTIFEAVTIPPAPVGETVTPGTP